MTLVFGGAYMGKQDYAKAHLGAGEIEQCGSDLPSFRTGCVAGLERFSLACAEQSGMPLRRWRPARPSGRIVF